MRLGLAASACFAAADLAWLALARPPGLALVASWFTTLVVAGAFLPGLANQVTMARAHMAAPALVYSLVPTRLLHLAAVVGVAGLSDLADGVLARRCGGPSRLGGALDPVVDGLFFGAVGVGLAAGGAYPYWVAGVVVARYGLPALAGGLLLLAGRRPDLHHTPLGQASTALIAVLLGALALFRGFGWPAAPLVTAIEALVPAAALATFANLAWANRQAIMRSGPSHKE